MAPIPLDCLPQEILARIASSGPAESVLALAKTCRTLHHACYNTIVFKAVIECQRPLWNESKMLDVPALSRYIGQEDTQAWARFAVADQRGMEFRDRIGPSDGIQVMSSEYISLCNTYVREGFESWAPHLFVARCKSSQIQRAMAK
jgi:F-box domain